MTEAADQFAQTALDYITMWQRDFAPSLPGDPGIPFAEIFMPEVVQDVEQLLARHPIAADVEARKLASQCVQLLSDVAAQPLQFLFANERNNGHSLDQFVSDVRRDQLAGVVAEFPELEPALQVVRSTWLEALGEFLDRCQADQSQLEQMFGIAERSTLADLRSGCSDRHHGGRSVFEVIWSNGSRLVYKPRHMGLEKCWNELLAWINATGFRPAFRTLNVVDRGAWGWVEFCHAEPPTDEGSWQSYLQSAGSLAALCWVLDAIDMHMGNLVSTSDGPVLIDVETFFQTKVCSRNQRCPGIGQLGFFPRWQEVAGCQVDLSGLGGFGDQSIPCRVPRWSGIGTHEMRLDYVAAVMRSQGATTIRRVSGQTNCQYPLAGYRQMMEFMRQHRSELLATEGPLARMWMQPVRRVPQSTREYYASLNKSLQLDSLRRLEQRRELLRALSGEQPDAIVVESLLALDIPRFTQLDEAAARSETELRLQAIDDSLVARHCRQIEQSMTEATAANRN
ncbi:MAG: type 2 lanthipeptide synthetase LanM [Pirellulaceae bacterium]